MDPTAAVFCLVSSEAVLGVLISLSPVVTSLVTAALKPSHLYRRTLNNLLFVFDM